MISLLLFSLAAYACDPFSLPQTTPPNPDADRPAKVTFTLDGKILRAHFEVASPSVYGPPKMGHNQYPYMFDVAEVFVSAEGGVPYYEFEVTPHDAVFDVRIHYLTPPKPGVEPKKVFQNGVNVGIEHKASIGPQSWTVDMGIPLERIGWKGDPAKITGNAFVMLGQGKTRRFFSRSLPDQDSANFHHPEFFKPLLDCTP